MFVVKPNGDRIDLLKNKPRDVKNTVEVAVPDHQFTVYCHRSKLFDFPRLNGKYDIRTLIPTSVEECFRRNYKKCRPPRYEANAAQPADPSDLTFWFVAGQRWEPRVDFLLEPPINRSRYHPVDVKLINNRDMKRGYIPIKSSKLQFETLKRYDGDYIIGFVVGLSSDHKSPIYTIKFLACHSEDCIVEEKFINTLNK